MVFSFYFCCAISSGVPHLKRQVGFPPGTDKKILKFKLSNKMSYIPSTNVQCERIQKKLDDMFVACANPLDPMPAMEAILAFQDMSGIAQEVYDGAGKVKTIRVTYDQRLLESSITEVSGARTCTATTENNNEYTDYTIDTTRALKGEAFFKGSDLATVCTETVEEMIIKKLNQILDAMERAAATKHAIELVGLAGNWSSTTATGSTPGTVNGSDELILQQFTVTATKQIDHTSMSELDLAIMQAGYCGPAIIVGGKMGYQYGQFVNHGCCSTSGVNVVELANSIGSAIFYDKRVKAALNSEAKSIVFQGGSVAMLYYNEFSQTPLAGSDYVKRIFFTPRLSLPVDVTIKDDCGQFSIVAYMNTKLVGLPTDMFAAGDEHEGQTFVNKILWQNPA